MASRDAVTGLLSGDEMVRRIERQKSSPSALVCFELLDMDLMKATLGYDTSNAVVALVGKRILDGSRDADVAARVGPERLALLLPGIFDERTASEVASRLLRKFFEPATIAGLDLDLTAAIGIAMLDATTSGAEAVQRAQIALDAARRSGSSLEVFRPEHDHHSDDSVSVISNVQRALDNGEFEAYLQPVVDSVSGKALSVEALVRWVHPEQGFIPPSLFLQQIEYLPVGRRFSLHMLDLSIAALASLENCEIGLSVNFSARDVEDPNLPLAVQALLEHHEVAPKRLTLEVPESVGVNGSARRVLVRLADLGCGIAIDDFGGSAVPMEFFALVNVTEVKIASRFTSLAADDSVARSVIRLAVGLCGAAGIATTAKGVERQNVLDSVVELGCTAAQGFHIAHPMPPVEVASWLKNERVYV